MKKIIIISLVIFMAGCMQEVAFNNIEAILEVCDNNQGIKSVIVDSMNTEQYIFEEIICKDGARFSSTTFVGK